MSPASRGRGLKLVAAPDAALKFQVARFTRAWIETASGNARRTSHGLSPASRGRGLKLFRAILDAEHEVVARFTRAWIETDQKNFVQYAELGRPLHAGVD